MSYKRKRKMLPLDFEEHLIFWVGLISSFIGITVFTLVKWSRVESDALKPGKKLVESLGSEISNINDLILLLAALFMAYMVFRAKESLVLRKQTSEFYAKIQEDLEQIRSHQTYGEIVSQDDIYSKKTECIRKCRKNKDLSHMNYAISLTSFRPDNPRDSSNPDVQTYHDELEDYIINHDVSVRRLVSISTVRKAEWVRDLAKLKDHRFELRLYQAPDNTPKPLTIDIYGKEHVFITFWDCNDRASHVYFVSEKIRNMFESYYATIWMQQETIIHPALSDQPGNFNAERVASIIANLPPIIPR